ncbi:Nif3-like dinuclear metal center hexameric protein [Buchnera aphidicola]|uniref:Nif3-like dinuclear metal center hexameric protein n=1 Tax=Buchnera aphidicola TaxID=9 RepID=UPI002093566C|nr:Nif3-like dinuclear metal center hexameric protein [Buchnera aphidicola]USS94326.1 Nif3-like dinuclear metal center hexameric protein [Buchnera aphidicola (Sipha maydis)]WII23485.1 Nif3-like dinuclear metal center hexameric protein [Buchnera aphidicola (Sipha maydis)]
MNNQFLENLINTKLNSSFFNDCTYNGLQIEGCQEINKIITGVTACQILLQKAIFYNAQAIIVHHGYFWKNEPKYIKGYIKERLKTILLNNINLYSWHLPLDAHKKLGNNAYIAQVLNIIQKGYINPYLWWGMLKKPISGKKLFKKISKIFSKKPIYISGENNKKILNIAWCSGKGQKFIHEVIQRNIDCFITGEISEEITHYVRESNMHFFAVGHHATEIGGVQLLGEWLKSVDKKLDIKFINVDNPA